MTHDNHDKQPSPPELEENIQSPKPPKGLQDTRPLTLEEMQEAKPYPMPEVSEEDKEEK